LAVPVFIYSESIGSLRKVTMAYGHFDNNKREYVITNPQTPVKWINYVGTLDFGGLIDHTGGALICKEDPALNRITKYIPQLPDADFKGTTLYLRLHQKNDYKVFSPYYVPTLDKFDRYECRVGMGYTRIISEFYGIRTEVAIFVPQNANCLIRDIKITNLNDNPVTVDAIPVVEYTHFDALKQYTNADWVPQTMQSEIVTTSEGFTILAQYAFMKKDNQVNYFTSNMAASSYETDRALFLQNYSNWSNPKILQQDELSNSQALRGDNIAAILHHLGELQPGETKRLITQLGQSENVGKTISDASYYYDAAHVDDAFYQLNRYWDKYLSTIQTETPNAAMNNMINSHHPHQCHTTKNWSRYLSLYQLGLGARGIGFRDSSQDVMSVMAHMPDEARELMEKLLSVQLRNGSAMHQFFPLTMEGMIGEAGQDERPDYYGDDHLWIVQSVSAYIKETGDTAFLDKVIPFYDKDKNDEPIESGTVMEHLQRSIEFTRNDTGRHGLPLAGFADWNDTVNLPKGAESLFNANLYGRALLELIDLAEYMDNAAALEKYHTYYDEMKEVVNQEVWDGEWYIRYFDHEGNPIGSHSNHAGKIFTNAQSWTVMSGFATEERAITALDSVFKHLNTPKGIKLSTPGYNGFDPIIGGVSTYPPGAKENGGVFLHSNPWVIIAETMLGRGNRAFEYYNQTNPAAGNDAIDEFECEPYVYPQNILGDEHPQFGLARNSWLSGTASWMYQAAIQYILGVLPTHYGLKINPCIPQEWDKFTIRRNFRGVTYIINVTNPDNVSKGVKLITIDGESHDDQIIPIFTDGGEHHIDVIMG
jgi:cellobiose phosphorylase